MSTPEGPPDEAPRHPGRARGSHAAPPTKLRLFLRSMSAVLLVAALVALLLQWRGNDTPDLSTQGPAVVSPTPSPTPSASPTLPPATPIRPSATPSPKPTRVVLPLSVLNNSRRTGLAARAAAQFRRGGWPAQSKGNYRATKLSATTVFYTKGNAKEKAAAESLHRQFPHVERVEPRISGLGTSGLTVVLTADYPA